MITRESFYAAINQMYPYYRIEGIYEYFVEERG